jgi:tetratricopeptide (TPR) repeat protein
VWWLWPHLRRLWAGVGTVTAGIVITYLYSLLSEQPLPHLSVATDLLHAYGRWMTGTLLALALITIAAERANRRHEARAPQPLRLLRRSWRYRFQGLAPHATLGATSASTMVGRASELTKLNNWFAHVKTGTRRIIFISGEPGIGKTTLTHAFADSLSSNGLVRIGRGQCVEQYGAGEPYMPILEALTRMCREPGGEMIVDILHRVAPAWLAQMPSLISAEDRARLQGLAQSATQQRMLREMAEALEVIAAEAPLILFLEDLHWSDPSTLDLIATVARRAESARLMILGTYRPVETLAGEHPLRAIKEELELHQQGIELRLKLLGEPDVAAYLERRFSNRETRESLEHLAPAIYARSEGNPLFMVNVVDYLVEQGSLLNANTIEAPHNIRQMIERNLQRLGPDEQRVLEAASVAGAEFSAAAVAAALERPVHDIETICTSLSRREQFIAKQGSADWPDGTVASNFRFYHALYQNVLYGRLPDGQRVDFHRRIAEREETAYGEHAAEIAAELANHYRRPNDADKAARYFRLAGERAVVRRAYREAERHYRDALAMLLSLPESTERDVRELSLQLALGSVVMTTQGWSAADTDTVYERVRKLAEHGGKPESIEAFYGLWAAAVVRGDLRESLILADQLLETAREAISPSARVTAHFVQGLTHHWLGNLTEARSQFGKAIEQYRPEDFSGFAEDYGVGAQTFDGLNEWLLGFPDHARLSVDKARAHALSLSKPFAVAYVDEFRAWTCGLTGDFEGARSSAEECEKIATEVGFPTFAASGKIAAGWARAHLGEVNGALDTIRRGLAEFDVIKFYIQRGFSLSLLSEAQALSGAIDDAIVTAEQALAHNPDELWSRPFTLVLSGKLRLSKDPKDFAPAEQDFRDAIDLSRKMSAKSLELRATNALARLLSDSGRPDEARSMLGKVYGWFTEGFDTHDLKEAKALLDELKNEPN